MRGFYGRGYYGGYRPLLIADAPLRLLLVREPQRAVARSAALGP